MRCYDPFVVFLAAAVLFITAGCETTVDVELPDHEPRLVINELFVADSAWRVSVTRSQGIQEADRRAAPPVENATVVIRANDRVVDTLTYTDEEIYRSLDADASQPQVGTPYTLRVSAPGFETAEATGQAPRPVPFRIALREGEHSDVDVTITDPAGRDNYYALFVYEKIVGPERTVRQALLFTSASPLLKDDVQIDFGDGGRARYERALFTDETFQGETRRVTLRIRDLETPSQLPPEVERFVIVVLASLSEASYEYQRTADLADDTEDNPFSEPVQVFSNVNGGLGIFAGATWVERTLPRTSRASASP